MERTRQTQLMDITVLTKPALVPISDILQDMAFSFLAGEVRQVFMEYRNKYNPDTGKIETDFEWSGYLFITFQYGTKMVPWHISGKWEEKQYIHLAGRKRVFSMQDRETTIQF